MASKAIKLGRCASGVCRALEAIRDVQAAVVMGECDGVVLALLEEARGRVLEIEDSVGVVTPQGLFEGGA